MRPRPRWRDLYVLGLAIERAGRTFTTWEVEACWLAFADERAQPSASPPDRSPR